MLCLEAEVTPVSPERHIVGAVDGQVGVEGAAAAESDASGFALPKRFKTVEDAVWGIECIIPGLEPGENSLLKLFSGAHRRSIIPQRLSFVQVLFVLSVVEEN